MNSERRRIFISVFIIMAVQKLKLPTFTHDVDSWIMHVEAFLAQTDATDAQKHNAVVGALPTEVVACVRDSVINPPAQGKFEALKRALIQHLGRSKFSYMQELNNVELGGRRPSSLLSQMQRLNVCADMQLPDHALRQLHTQKMPAALQLHLASLDDTLSIHEYGRRADRIFAQHQHQDGNSSTQACLVSEVNVENSSVESVFRSNVAKPPKTVSPANSGTPLQPRSDSSESDTTVKMLIQKVSDLEQLVRSMTRPANHAQYILCFYHERFGNRARQCTPPCSWSGNANSGGW